MEFATGVTRLDRKDDQAVRLEELDMSNILEFRVPHHAKPLSHGTAAAVQAAEVVIFPGIRYERWDEAPASRPSPDDEAPARGRRKRNGK